MAIKTSCPKCACAYTLANTMAGKNVKCKSCGNPFTIGSESAAVASVATKPSPGTAKTNPLDFDAIEDSPRPSKKKSGALKWVLIGGGGLVACMMLLVCGGGGVAGYFVFFYKSDKATIADNTDKKNKAPDYIENNSKPDPKLDLKSDPNQVLNPDPIETPPDPEWKTIGPMDKSYTLIVPVKAKPEDKELDNAQSIAFVEETTVRLRYFWVKADPGVEADTYRDLCKEWRETAHEEDCKILKEGTLTVPNGEGMGLTFRAGPLLIADRRCLRIIYVRGTCYEIGGMCQEDDTIGVARLEKFVNSFTLGEGKTAP